MNRPGGHVGLPRPLRMPRAAPTAPRVQRTCSSAGASLTQWPQRPRGSNSTRPFSGPVTVLLRLPLPPSALTHKAEKAGEEAEAPRRTAPPDDKGPFTRRAAPAQAAERASDRTLSFRSDLSGLPQLQTCRFYVGEKVPLTEEQGRGGRQADGHSSRARCRLGPHSSRPGRPGGPQPGPRSALPKEPVPRLAAPGAAAGLSHTASRPNHGPGALGQGEHSLRAPTPLPWGLLLDTKKVTFVVRTCCKMRKTKSTACLLLRAEDGLRISVSELSFSLASNFLNHANYEALTVPATSPSLLSQPSLQPSEGPPLLRPPQPAPEPSWRQLCPVAVESAGFRLQ